MILLRLTKEEITKITKVAREVFGDEVEVYIFGSRTQLDKKGGDIDVLIKTKKEIPTDDKLSFLAKLELAGIERRVDLLVIASNIKLKDIHMEALKTGVKIS